MPIDQRWALGLNNWGRGHIFLVTALANNLVFIITAIGAGMLVFNAYQNQRASRIRFDFKAFTLLVLKKGAVIFAVPVIIVTIFSEIVSTYYVRRRPFVTMPNIKLLFPHSDDGGVPSHHMVFMVAIATCLFIFNKKVASLLAVLSLFSGVARVAAGIHYPTDILAGAFLGWIVPTLYFYLFRRINIFRRSVVGDTFTV